MKIKVITMKAKELRKNALKLGVTFLVAGWIIAVSGFAISGFDVDAFRQTGEFNFFRTINF
jgi:hypothetical protein